MSERLLVLLNLTLLGLVAVPVAAVLFAGARSLFVRRRRRVEWVHVAGIGDLPVLRE